MISLSIYDENENSQNDGKKIMKVSSEESIGRWKVSYKTLRHLPKYYPLENTSIFLPFSASQKEEPESRSIFCSDIASRITECCRKLSIQTSHHNDKHNHRRTTTFLLRTPEFVELCVTFWKKHSSDRRRKFQQQQHHQQEEEDDESGIIVECQRRRGDSMIYHHYTQCILDAAKGKDYDHWQCQFLKRMREEEHEIKKVIQDVDSDDDNEEYDSDEFDDDEFEDEEYEYQQNVLFLSSFDIAMELFRKDREDAKILGLESLKLLTDPKKTDFETALTSSRNILFGSAAEGTVTSSKNKKNWLGKNRSFHCAGKMFQEEEGDSLEKELLNIAKFGGFGIEGGYESSESDFMMDSDSDDDDDDDDDADESTFGKNTIPCRYNKEYVRNLALHILSNSLVMVEKMGNRTKSKRDCFLRSNSAKSFFSNPRSSCSLSSTELIRWDMLQTLISIIDKAPKSPHDAYLAARCLNSLCRLSSRAEEEEEEDGEVVNRLVHLYATDAVASALEFGRASHRSLELESEKLLVVLKERDVCDF